MADYERFCSECFLPIPPIWTQRYSPCCGARIKLRIVKKRRPSQAHPKPAADREREKEKKAPKKIRVSRKLTSRDTFSMFSYRKKSVLGPRFLSVSPAPLFVLDILTLGIRSAFWVTYHLPSLAMMAKPEEKNIKSATYLWLLSYFASIALGVAGAINLFINSLAPEAALYSTLMRGSAASFCVSFLTGRHVLYWSREVIADELASSKIDAVRSRAGSFAPSSLMIWFLGVSYIQLHINRMIKKKGLNTYSASRRSAKKIPPPES
jgi:hypothetical protein